jgi:Fe-S cluster assembly protein SufD
MTTVQEYRSQLEGLELLHRGPNWLRALRADAFSLFEREGFPTSKNEEWKYTSLRAVEQQSWERVRGADGAYRLEVEGPAAELLHLYEEDAPDYLEATLGALAPTSHAPLVSLNTALYWRVNVLDLRDVDGEELGPVRVRHHCGAHTGPWEAHPRMVVLVGPGKKHTLVEEWLGEEGASYFVNPVTEIALGEGAHLDHHLWQQHPRGAQHVQTVAARCDQGASYDAWALWLGASLSRADLHVALEEGASCRLDGIYLAGDEQHVDVHSAIEHQRPHATSRQTYKGILAGKSHGVFNGKVYIRPDAQKADAVQANHNLLLSRDAEIDTKPQLEIFADDVKAAHGSTVGQLDEEHVFYLRSRGIPEVQARRMLTAAFALDVVEAIPDEALRGEARERVEQKLHQLSGGVS